MKICREFEASNVKLEEAAEKGGDSEEYWKQKERRL